MTIGNRIKTLRTEKKLTQSQLAEMVGLSYIQVGRYETQKSTPSSEVIQKLAEALVTTTDFLMNGNHDDVISTQLKDRELLEQFKQVEKLDAEDKHLIKTFLDAFLVKRKIQTII